MNKEVLAIDWDDVIVDTAPEIINHYNRTYGTSLGLDALYSRDLEVWQAPDYDTAIRRVNAYLETDEYFELPPTQEAVATIRQLHERFDQHIVTGRPDFTAIAGLRWLERHFPDIFSTVVYTNYFKLSEGETASRSKADVCLELGAKALIDDHLDHGFSVARAGIDVLVFGKYSWNQTDEPLLPNMRRVANWKEVGAVLLG